MPVDMLRFVFVPIHVVHIEQFAHAPTPTRSFHFVATPSEGSPVEIYSAEAGTRAHPWITSHGPYTNTFSISRDAVLIILASVRFGCRAVRCYLKGLIPGVRASSGDAIFCLNIAQYQHPQN